MSSTTTSYISKIKQTYPTAGVDNDSQGFRDNFKNIALALTSVNTEVEDITLNAFKLNQTNNFDGNIILDAALQDCSQIVYDDTLIAKTGNIAINYTNGSYQKFRLASGNHEFSVYNFPDIGRAGSVIVQVTTSTTASTSISFTATNLINLGIEVYPFSLTGQKPYLFEVFTDGSENNLFVRKIGDEAAPAEDADVDAINVTADNLTSDVQFNLQGNILKTNSARDVVMSIGNSAGELALVPNQVMTTFLGAVLDPPYTSSLATKISVFDSSGIKVGAKFTFVSNTLTNVYSVTQIADNTIYTQSFDSIYIPAGTVGGIMTFTNVMPTTATSVALIKSIEPTTSTAAKGDLKGQIYANSTTLWVSYNDYAPNTTNWFNIEKSTGVVTDKSTKLATTEFVHHVLPFGTIVMWYGLIANIPTGWALCDGQNNTPDLRDKFVIGATSDSGGQAKTNITGTFAKIGGTKDSIVISHTHSASVTDTGHRHFAAAGVDATSTYPNFSVDNTNQMAAGNGSSGGFERYILTGVSDEASVARTSSSTTGVSVSNATTGTSGTNANLPPYYALAYIMKTSGQ